MLWLLNDLDLAALLLRAAAFALEALLLGGVAFLLFVLLPASAALSQVRLCCRGVQWAAAGLMLANLCSLEVTAGLLAGTAGLPAGTVLTSGPALMQECAAVLALLLLASIRNAARASGRIARGIVLTLGAALFIPAVALSHAEARLEHRAVLAAMTALHHLGTAVWIGAMPYLLLTLREEGDSGRAVWIARRFSRMAMTGAALLVIAGCVMGWFYVGPLSGLWGTPYGILLLAKLSLLLLILPLGGVNWTALRPVQSCAGKVLLRLRRFSEVEIGLGFTAILAAASLTAQPPAVDVVHGRVTAHEIAERFRPQMPRMTSPPLADLTPPASIETAAQGARDGFLLHSDATDMKWSEYNHHWAGLMVLLAGILAFLSRFRKMRWARYWPATFAALAVFVLLRADPETWPLGPRPFWKSFSQPDVLEHRAYAALILLFAAFECGVQAGSVRARWARLVFPGVCAAGGALLLTHSHGMGEAQEELLVQMSHVAIALLGVLAGWARWLEVRLPAGSLSAGVARLVWPAALISVGMLLLNYREL